MKQILTSRTERAEMGICVTKRMWLQISGSPFSALQRKTALNTQTLPGTPCRKTIDKGEGVQGKFEESRKEQERTKCDALLKSPNSQKYEGAR